MGLENLAGGFAAVLQPEHLLLVAIGVTLGTLVAFMAYQARLMGPVQGLMGIYTNLATARASLVRVHDLLDTTPDVLEPLPEE